MSFAGTMISFFFPFDRPAEFNSIVPGSFRMEFTLCKIPKHCFLLFVTAQQKETEADTYPSRKIYSLCVLRVCMRIQIGEQDE